MAIFSQRCRHADGGFRISGRRQLVQRGGKPAPDAPTLLGTTFVAVQPRRCRILAGTRTSFTRWGGQPRQDGPASSTRSTATFRVYALQKPARSYSRFGIVTKRSFRVRCRIRVWSFAIVATHLSESRLNLKRLQQYAKNILIANSTLSHAIARPRSECWHTAISSHRDEINYGN